jgi:hypothetical protein
VIPVFEPFKNIAAWRDGKSASFINNILESKSEHFRKKDVIFIPKLPPRNKILSLIEYL